ncbi:MAG TPA: hypothetical protein VF939_19915 [Puia sp.]
MNRKALHISRQILVGIIALQLLNLGVGSQAYWDYDYSYAYNKTYDPTETAVEWIIELEYGQQPDFSYDNCTDTNKNISKSLHWQTDLYIVSLEAPYRQIIKKPVGEPPVKKIPTQFPEIISPPPESTPA